MVVLDAAEDEVTGETSDAQAMKRRNGSSLSNLDAGYAHLATEWSVSSKAITQMSGEDQSVVSKWRAPYIKAYLEKHGYLPPMKGIRMPGSRSGPEKNVLRQSGNAIPANRCNASLRLDVKFGHLATQWSMTNRQIADLSQEDLCHVGRWRRPYVEAYLDNHGRLPPLKSVQMPKSRRPKRDLRPLDETHADMATDWHASTTRIADQSGHHRAAVMNWRRRHLKAWIAQGNPAPLCTCGGQIFHMGACGSVPKHLRREAAAKILAGGDPDAVARTYRTDRIAILSWTMTALPTEERTAFKNRLKEERKAKRARMAETADRRRAADARHSRILGALSDKNPEYDDAVQEAYLAMLEEGLEPEEAANTGRKRANRIASIGWNASSLDAPIGTDGTMTMMDRLADQMVDASPACALASIDAQRMEGAPIRPMTRTIASRPELTHHGSQALAALPAPTAIDPKTSRHRTDETMTDPIKNEDLLLEEILKAHREAGSKMKAAAQGARIRNVDATDILSGRMKPSRARLGRLADHFGIPHDIPPSESAARPEKGMGGRRTAKRGEAMAPAAVQLRVAKPEGAPQRSAAIEQASSPATTTGPNKTSDDAGIVPALDALIGMLQQARKSETELAEAKAELADLKSMAEVERLRAEKAEAELASLQEALNRVKATIAQFASDGSGAANDDGAKKMAA
jgi:hypothetical protein